MMQWIERLGYDPSKTVLIIHADDGGASEEHDYAILDCFQERVITSASAMVYGRSFGHFAEKVSPTLRDVGIHLECKVADSVSKGKIDQEFENQYGKFVDKIIPTHMDTHGGVVFSNGPLLESYLGFSKLKKLPALTTYRPNFMEHNLKSYRFPIMTNILMAPNDLLMESRLDWMKKALGTLYPGLYQLIVHPQANASPIGSSDYWALRQPSFRKLIKDEKFLLTDWRDVSKRSMQKFTCLA
jgi:hypothetical protein